MLPLVARRDLDDIFAYRADGPVRVRDFLADAAALAALLPASRHLLNVCQDRYRFAVGFAAGLLGDRISLQPASLSAETLHRIRAASPDVVCLCDGEFASHDLPRFDFPADLAGRPEVIVAIPEIPGARIAARLYTSGSTGVPVAHDKHWAKLVANGRAGAERLGLLAVRHNIVGTVPAQHSYGFESTILLALHGNAPFWSGKPFYPQDIAAALAAVPAPRLLVSTPFHLAALIQAGIELPPVDRLLSATAPLSGQLAGEIEKATGAPLHEIYGSTESGQLASRRTTVDDAWELLADVRLEQADATTFALGGHVEGRIGLSDSIELCPDGRFLLHGRHADLINIAGKRTSLAYLNHQLAGIDGVRDGAFFLPDETAADGITRLCAFVVAPGRTPRELLAALRHRIDPIFLPRPLVLLDALPRNSTGKLPRNELQALYASRVAHAEG